MLQQYPIALEFQGDYTHAHTVCTRPSLAWEGPGYEANPTDDGGSGSASLAGGSGLGLWVLLDWPTSGRTGMSGGSGSFPSD